LVRAVTGRLRRTLIREDLVGAQCRAVVGLGLATDDKWRSGEHMVGVWYSTPEDSRASRRRAEEISAVGSPFGGCSARCNYI
jgi:hypothetical protein